MKIPEEIKNLIINYYRDDSNCYICPGEKQCISVRDDDGNKKKESKKLLGFTLDELYNNFLHDYTDKLEVIPKFSYFASLKPRDCVFAGDPGTHSICVCDDHENVRLRLLCLDEPLKYKEIFTQAFCNIEKRDCMLHECKTCPGLPKIQQLLDEYLKDDTREITYKFWVEEGSRAKLETLKSDADSFKKSLAQDIHDLSIHHYIASEQKKYLTSCKENIEEDTCIIIMDFSENYAFQIQNSVQAFYYNNTQATIHPFLIYYKRENENSNEEAALQHACFCVISDARDHIAYSIHAFMDKMMTTIKTEFPWIKKIIYFSDGAPNQYKNK